MPAVGLLCDLQGHVVFQNQKGTKEAIMPRSQMQCQSTHTRQTRGEQSGRGASCSWLEGGWQQWAVAYLALVRATLRRLGSFRNPIPWCSLARTQERMMKSFSRPWKASTLAISTS